MADNPRQSKWNGLVITCPNEKYAAAIRNEIRAREKNGHLPSYLTTMCVHDPKEGFGSGGATINALLAITERLSAQNGFTVLTSDVLQEARIIIVHMGRSFPYSICGKGFVALPLAKTNQENDVLVTNFDALFHIVTKQLGVTSPPGVWVCSTDMMLQVPGDYVTDWTDYTTDSAYCFSVPGDVKYATRHGVFKVGQSGVIRDILYQKSEAELKNEEIIDPSIVTGIVFLPTQVAEKILDLHVYSPIDSSTYQGVDSGCAPVQLSLFFDILLAMTSDMDEEKYFERTQSYWKQSSNSNDQKERAHSIIWKTLHQVNLKSILIPGGSHHYLSVKQTPQLFARLLHKTSVVEGYKLVNICHSFIDKNCHLGKDAVVINSILSNGIEIGEGSHIFHSHLQGRWKIGKNCVIIGVNDMNESKMDIPDDSFVMGVHMDLPSMKNTKVHLCLPCANMANGNNIFCTNDQGDAKILKNENYQKYFNLQLDGLDSESRVWLSALNVKAFAVAHMDKHLTMWNNIAVLLHNNCKYKDRKIWEVSWKMSFLEITDRANLQAEIEYRKKLFNLISCMKIKQMLLQNKRISLQPLLASLVGDKAHQDALNAVDEVVNNTTDLCVVTRAFFSIADILELMAGKKCGLRSGPACNKQWAKAFELLSDGNIKDGAHKLIAIRKSWMTSPHKLIRAARHYEGAAQLMIRKGCMTVVNEISVINSNMIPWNVWIVCEVSARIDLSGGWSDTPPICYENGGAVVNACLKIDGKRPIGCKIKRITDFCVRFAELDEHGQTTQIITCEKLSDFMDYNQPFSPGALLKACFVLTQAVDVNSTKSLKEQLSERFDGGFEIQTWANLPRGSGMGTSSILAGAALHAIYRASGKLVDCHSLLHSVLLLEQMLTTGGGWQDQVGGLIGGVKICRSKPALPLQITTNPIDCPRGFLEKFERHILLIYTGKTRLARNLLQEVLRNWYACEANVTTNCRELIKNAEACANAFEKGDLSAVASCITNYWMQKKVMAPGCEPLLCTQIMEALRPYALGQTLAGAGGGGFLFVVTKKEMTIDNAKNILQDLMKLNRISVHRATIDTQGMQTYMTKE